MPYEDTLAQIPLFSQFPRRHLTRLGKTLVSRNFPKGQLIVKEGDRAVGFFVITEGAAEVVRGLGGPNERALATLRAGDFFGEMALLDGYPRSASVRALEDTECLVLSRWDFLAELRQSPHMAASMLPILSARLRQAEKAPFH